MNITRPRLRTTVPTALLAAAALLVLSACSTSDDSNGSAPEGSSGKTIDVRIPDPGNSGVLALGKKDGSLDKALGKVGARVKWTGSAGPFA